MRLIRLLATALALAFATPASAQPAETFSLLTPTGLRLTSADLLGKPYAIFFGFTHCPEVCPTTLAELQAVLDEIGPDADKLSFFFVTIDPERDGGPELANYLDAFGERFVGLHGSAEETAAAARAFRVVYNKVPLDGGGYTMDHTAAVFLVDRRGRLVDKLAYQMPLADQVQRLKRLIAGP
jgi:protein SCO1/2